MVKAVFIIKVPIAVKVVIGIAEVLLNFVIINADKLISDRLVQPFRMYRYTAFF